MRHAIGVMVSFAFLLIGMMIACSGGDRVVASAVFLIGWLIRIETDVADIRRRLKQFEPPETDDLI